MTARPVKTRSVRSHVALACAALACLAACGPVDDVDVSSDGTMRLAVPPQLEVRAVDVANLRVRVLVGTGEDTRNVPPTRDGDGFAARVTVPEGSDVPVSITWFERIVCETGTDDLPLVEVELFVRSIGGDETVSIGAADYDDTGLDEDEDGRTNLDERGAGTDPYPAGDPCGDPDGVTDPGDVPVRARLPRIDPADAPVIDGSYDPIWNSAQYRDTGNDELAIDNLMIDFDGTRTDGASGYRWGALHDGEALYLIVFAESGAAQTPFGDSADAFNDDSIDVYFDADNSRLDQYDGVNDRHLILPLLDANGSPNSSASADARLDFGPNTAPFDRGAVSFAACPCPGEVQIYEVRLPLAEFGLPIDAPFGFAVQINDDSDGGDRDAKWGWVHPAREGNDTADFTFRDPSFMRPIELRP